MSNVQAAFKILGEVQSAYISRISDWVVLNEDELRERAAGEAGYMASDEVARVSEELRQIAMVLACFPQSQPQQAQPKQQPKETATFGLWIAHMNAGNYQQAVYMLAVLLNIEPPLAEHCVQHFAYHLQFDGSLFHRVASLRDSVVTGHVQTTVQTLAYCFGLEANAAVHIATHLHSTEV